MHENEARKWGGKMLSIWLFTENGFEIFQRLELFIFEQVHNNDRSMLI
jgi:hypothetical protein